MTGHCVDPVSLGLRRLVSLIWPLDEASKDDAELARELNRQVLARLDTAWGKGLSSYSAAPYLSNAHSSAGWQDARGPKEFVAALIFDLDQKSWQAAGQPFCGLDHQTAEKILHAALADGAAASNEVQTGFSVLQQLTYDILFGDTWDATAIGWEWLDRGIQSQRRV